jgi:arylsulfatase A
MVTKDTMHHGSRAIYKAMVERIDDGVGMILAELEKSGLADNTLVVFSSDNGGERWARNAPLFPSQATVWEGGIRVPCLMRWPAKLPKGKRSPHRSAITMDLHATFIAAAGVPKPPKEKPLDGIDLIPLLTGEKPSPRPHLLLAHRPLESQAKGHPPRQMEVHQRRQHDGPPLRLGGGHQ